MINPPVCEGYDVMMGYPPGTQRILFCVAVAIFGLLSFPLAADLASTSTHCDYLMDELNEARIKAGKDCHLKIHCLETSLKQLNNGQGLGFVMGGTVIDKRFLGILAAQIVAAFGPIITYMLSLAENSSDGSVAS